MEKKKLLILNGSHSEIPLIEAGKELGFHVITSGDDPGLIGHKYADEYHSVDYSDKEAILRLSVDLEIDYICSCANDFGVITASYVAENMGLPGHDACDTTLLLHHKDSFKRLSLELDLPVPYGEYFDNEKEAIAAIGRLSFPLIIKPIDLTGGKGVSRVDDKHEYIGSVEKAFYLSREKRVVVEEYFVGGQHSFSSFIVNQKVVFYFSDNEYSPVNPYYVSISAAPAIDIGRYASILVGAIEKIARHLELEDGIFHIQYIADGNEAKIIDITRRCSGDMYPYPVNYATNIDWAYWIVRGETGLDCSGFPEITQSGYCGRYCVMSKKNGIVKNVVISDDIKKYIYDELFWWKQGDVIGDRMTYKAGIVFLRYGSMKEMLDVTEHLPELIRVEVLSDDM